MKLGSLSKCGKRNTIKSNAFDYDFIFANYDGIFIFLIYFQLETIAKHAILTFSLVFERLCSKS